MSKVIYHEAFAKTIILNRKFTVLKKMDRTSFISSYNSRKQSSRRQSWQLSYNWKMEWEINLIKLNGKLNTRSLRVWLSFWSLYVGLKKLRIEDRRLKPESATVVVHKKAAFKNIAKLTGNHLFQGLFFNIVADVRTPLVAASGELHANLTDTSFKSSLTGCSKKARNWLWRNILHLS